MKHTLSSQSLADPVKVYIIVVEDQNGTITHQFDPPFAYLLKGIHEVSYHLQVINDRNKDKFEILAVYACDPHGQLSIPPIPPGSQTVTLKHLNQKPCLINIGIVVRDVTSKTVYYCDPEIINDPSRIGPHPIDSTLSKDENSP